MEHIENATATALPAVREYIDSQENKINVLDSLYEKGRESDHFDKLVDFVTEKGGVNTNESTQNYTDPILKAVATIMLERPTLRKDAPVDADDPKRSDPGDKGQAEPHMDRPKKASQKEITDDYTESNKENENE